VAYSDHDQEFESAVRDIAGIAHASVAEVRASLARSIRLLRNLDRYRTARSANDPRRRNIIKAAKNYRTTISVLDKAVREYLDADRRFREAVAANEDPLSRIPTWNPESEINSWGLLMMGEDWRQMEVLIHNFLPEFGNQVDFMKLVELSEIRPLTIPVAMLELLEVEIKDWLKKWHYPKTEQFRILLDPGGRASRKPGRPAGARSSKQIIREIVVHSLLDAASSGGGALTYDKNYDDDKSGTLWPALRRLSRCMPSGIVPARQQKAPRWLRDGYASWRKAKKLAG
jgi:hypothetical protein